MGDLLFFGSCNGMFRAVERMTGRVLWATQAVRGPAEYFFHSDPFVVADLVIVGADAAAGGGIHAFERSGGRQRWMHSAGRGVPGAISGAGQLAYAISFEGELLAIDVGSGSLRWSFPLTVRGWLAPAVAEGQVFAGSRDGVLYALNGQTGRVKWRSNLGAPISTSVVIVGTSLYVGTSDGSLHRVDRQDGVVRATHRIDATLTPRGLVATNASLLVLLADQQADDRALVSIDLSLNGVRWRTMANGRWSTSRAFVSNGTAVVGSPTGEVAAYCVADGTKAWSRLIPGTVRAIGGSRGVFYVGTVQGSLYALAGKTPCKVE